LRFRFFAPTALLSLSSSSAIPTTQAMVAAHVTNNSRLPELIIQRLRLPQNLYEATKTKKHKFGIKIRKTQIACNKIQK